MVELAHTRGLPMAHEIYKRHGDAGQDLYPTDVFDGSVWWFYDTHKHIWRVDKSGAHIHQTVYDMIKRCGVVGSVITQSKRRPWISWSMMPLGAH